MDLSLSGMVKTPPARADKPDLAQPGSRQQSLGHQFACHSAGGQGGSMLPADPLVVLCSPAHQGHAGQHTDEQAQRPQFIRDESEKVAEIHGGFSRGRGGVAARVRSHDGRDGPLNYSIHGRSLVGSCIRSGSGSTEPRRRIGSPGLLGRTTVRLLDVVDSKCISAAEAQYRHRGQRTCVQHTALCASYAECSETFRQDSPIDELCQPMGPPEGVRIQLHAGFGELQARGAGEVPQLAPLALQACSLCHRLGTLACVPRYLGGATHNCHGPFERLLLEIPWATLHG